MKHGSLKHKSPEVCSATGKVPLSEAQASRKVGTYLDIERYYFCNVCSGYHLTSQKASTTLGEPNLNPKKELNLLRIRVKELEKYGEKNEILKKENKTLNEQVKFLKTENKRLESNLVNIKTKLRYNGNERTVLKAELREINVRLKGVEQHDCLAPIFNRKKLLEEMLEERVVYETV